MLPPFGQTTLHRRYARSAILAMRAGTLPENAVTVEPGDKLPEPASVTNILLRTPMHSRKPGGVFRMRGVSHLDPRLKAPSSRFDTLSGKLASTSGPRGDTGRRALLPRRNFDAIATRGGGECGLESRDGTPDDAVERQDENSGARDPHQAQPPGTTRLFNRGFVASLAGQSSDWRAGLAR